MLPLACRHARFLFPDASPCSLEFAGRCGKDFFALCGKPALQLHWPLIVEAHKLRFEVLPACLLVLCRDCAD
jgi:hypothetical protein